MPSTFEKHNLKEQKEILVLNSPESFEPELKTLRGVTVQRDLKSIGKAIDEDWSAVRFHRAEFIKTLTRGKEHRMSAQGNARAARK